MIFPLEFFKAGLIEQIYPSEPAHTE